MLVTSETKPRGEEPHVRREEDLVAAPADDGTGVGRGGEARRGLGVGVGEVDACREEAPAQAGCDGEGLAGDGDGAEDGAESTALFDLGQRGLSLAEAGLLRVLDYFKAELLCVDHVHGVWDVNAAGFLVWRAWDCVALHVVAEVV